MTWRPGPRGLPADLALSARFRGGGERLRADGRNVTKTVKALFQEAHVPPWHRPGWPLLYVDDRLVAVPGLAIDIDVAVDDGLEPRWSPVEAGLSRPQDAPPPALITGSVRLTKTGDHK